MPVPSAITDLSTTAGSNSPAGTDPIGTDADNYIRAHAAFIAQLYAAIGRTTAMTASRALITDASAGVSASAVTSTELGYVSGVTSAIQTQLDAKAPKASPVITNYVYVNATAGNAAGLELSGNGNTQATGASINHNSNNDLVIYNRLNASMLFGTNNTTRLIIGADGIATFAGNVKVTNGALFSYGYGGDNNTGLFLGNSAGSQYIQNTNNAWFVSGGLMSAGLLKGNSGGSGLGAITVSTSAASGGSDGDVWFRY